mgnify:FL=1
MYIVNYETKKEIINDDSVFKDTIWQKETEDGSFAYDEKKLNKYSKALRLENGKVYDDIWGWIADVMGRNIIACIKVDTQDPNKRYISYFKPEDEVELKEDEKLMNIESVDVKSYVKEDVEKYRLEIFLREVQENEPNVDFSDLPFWW